MESLAEIRDRLLAQSAHLRAAAEPMDPPPLCPNCKIPLDDGECPQCGWEMEDDDKEEASFTDEAALLIESEKDGHVYLTAPTEIVGNLGTDVSREAAVSVDSAFMYLRGRFVQADTPNRNGAYWTSKDLELAQATIANGPLNWLHEERHIIGTLTGAKFAREKAGHGNHIVADATVWRYLWPAESRVIEQAAASRQLWYSMECVSETVTCMGCGETFAFEKAMREPASVCSHIRDRTHVRRFDQPTFLGGAVIVPPVQPGWANADATVMRKAAHLAEAASLSTEALTRPEAEAMVAQIIQWANR